MLSVESWSSQLIMYVLYEVLAKNLGSMYCCYLSLTFVFQFSISLIKMWSGEFEMQGYFCSVVVVVRYIT
jgi:hypothetical protein